MKGPRLAAIRKRLGLTQAQLADLLGVHWVTVSRWEGGHVSPNPWCLGLLQVFATIKKPKTVGRQGEGKDWKMTSHDWIRRTIEMLREATRLGIEDDEENLRISRQICYSAAHLLRRRTTPVADKDRNQAKEGP
jgi:transcriptional regulator with XRE-family HTH domain